MFRFYKAGGEYISYIFFIFVCKFGKINNLKN